MPMASRQVRNSYPEVHRKRGMLGMAPLLFGISHIEDGPSFIVMEHLLRKDWMTLFDFAERHPRWKDDNVRSTLRLRIQSIVQYLEERGLVHGDFCANNVMIKVGDEAKSVLIDFDWEKMDLETLSRVIGKVLRPD
jgi:hypothetical protein